MSRYLQQDVESGDAPPPTELSEPTISRAAADLENGSAVVLYRIGDHTLLTYDELYRKVDAEGAALPPEQWIDGVWDPHGYIIEACLVGIYDPLEAVAAMVDLESGETVVQYTGEDDQVVAERLILEK